MDAAVARRTVAKTPHGGGAGLSGRHESTRRMDSAREHERDWAEAPARSSGAGGDGVPNEGGDARGDARGHCSPRVGQGENDACD
jgi:hypothetical protein